MGALLKIAIAVGLGVMIYLWLRRLLGRTDSMPPSEARALLGVRDDATLAEIREAHRRLIARVHPDTGGSAELATRVNAARDALVAELNRTPPSAS
jgi:DnaJ homolog subfamily C member 19